MKVTKIFIASSIDEFTKERKRLGYFFNRMNNQLINQNMFCDVKFCEELDNAVPEERKQNEYNEFIRQSDLVVFLLGDSCGEYTYEEFKEALNIGNDAHILVFQRNTDSEDERIVRIKEDAEKDDRISIREYNTYTTIENEIHKKLQISPQESEEQYKKIQFFLGTSDKEQEERNEIVRFVLKLNSKLLKHNVYVQLENSQSEVSSEQLIMNADAAFFVFFEMADDNIRSDLDLALQQFRRFRKPKIYTYFYENQQDDDSILELKKMLDERIQHYYSSFTNVDSIKLSILLQISEIMEQSFGLLCGTLKFEEGQAVLDGNSVLSLQNVSLYCNNKTIRMLREELEKLEAEYEKILLECQENRSNFEMKQRRRQISKQIGEVSEKLQQLEEDILTLYQEIMKKRTDISISSWEREAVQLIEEGDYESAKIILRDNKRREELKNALTIVENGKEKIRQYISGKRTLINTLVASGLQKETVEEIIVIYEELVKLAEDYRMELTVLYDYAEFLMNQCQYSKALHWAKRLDTQYQVYECTLKDEGRLQNLLGLLYKENQLFDESENSYRNAIKIYQKLSKEDMTSNELNVAIIYDNLAALLSKVNRKKEAYRFHERALGTFRKLAEKNPVENESYVAACCNNLANLLDEINDKEAAEVLHREALEIRRRLAKEKPVTYDSEVAISCNNLAILLVDINRKKEAEVLFQEALQIRRRLAEENPMAYESQLAESCNNLAILLSECHRGKEAEILHREALEIRRQLAEENPMAYESQLAESCNNLAILLCECHREKEAEDFYKEALESFRQLAEDNERVYKPYVASCCYNLANLLSKVRKKEAELLYREALEISRQLALKEPEIYDADVAMNCNSIGLLMASTNHQNEAEEFYAEALSIHRRLFENNPEVYEADVAATCYNYANLLNDSGRLEEAELYYCESLEKFRRLMVDNPEVYELYVAKNCNNYGNLLKRLNRKEEAKSLYRESLEISRRCAEKSPGIYEMSIVKTCYNLSDVLDEIEDKAELKNLYEEVLGIYQRIKRS